MARCINLDAHEAKTAADGRLRVILRPALYVSLLICPYGSPGDVVVLREKWGRVPDVEGVIYGTDTTWDHEPNAIQWRSPATMPKNLTRFRPTIELVDLVRCTLISRQDAIGAGATRREWGKLTPFGRDYGWSMGWPRLGQLSQYAGGIHARNDKQPLREQDISLGSPQFAVANWWTNRWGEKHPWKTSWAWKLTLDWKRGEG